MFDSARGQTNTDDWLIAAEKGSNKVSTDQPLLVREADALRLTGLKRTTFRRLMSDGEFDSFKVGAARVFSVESIRDWIDRELSEQRSHSQGFRDVA